MSSSSASSLRLAALALLIVPRIAVAEDAPVVPTAPEISRTEISAFDGWRVTCNEYAEPKRRVCVASLQATRRENGQLVFAWNLAYAPDGTLTSTMVTPTGVVIAQGVEIRLGTAPVRKIAFATCEPDHCTARTSVDAAFRKEIVPAATLEVVVSGSTGQNMKLQMPLKGVDKALAALKP